MRAELSGLFVYYGSILLVGCLRLRRHFLILDILRRTAGAAGDHLWQLAERWLRR
jgi:hypothetical protein